MMNSKSGILRTRRINEVSRIQITRLSPTNHRPETISVLLSDIEKVIYLHGWFFFGTRRFGCPNLTEALLEYYRVHSRLPRPCSDCYKALIFWGEDWSEESVRNLFSVLNSFHLPYSGKFNHGVVVFYFKSKQEMDGFIAQLKRGNIAGTIQWRRACKEFQQLKPDLWKNAKVFLPDEEIR